MVNSLRKLNRISGRPIQNATTVAKNTYTNATQNSAFGRVTPKTVTSNDRFHRIGMKATTVETEEMAPNNSIAPVPTVGEFGEPPVPVVKISTSAWMR